MGLHQWDSTQLRRWDVFTQWRNEGPTVTATRASCHEARHDRRSLPHYRRRVSSRGVLLSLCVRDAANWVKFNAYISYFWARTRSRATEVFFPMEAYLSAMQNPKNPLHDAAKEETGCRLARGKSWMGQAEQSIQHVCRLAELKQVRDWEKRPVEFKPYHKTLLSENLYMHALPWMAGWKSQCRSIGACRSQQQSAWRDLHGRLSHKGPVWLGVHGQEGWKDCAQR